MAQRNVDVMEGREKRYVCDATVLRSKGLSAQQKAVDLLSAATSKSGSNGSQPKKRFFSKVKRQLGKATSIDKASATSSKLESLRWTP